MCSFYFDLSSLCFNNLLKFLFKFFNFRFTILNEVWRLVTDGVLNVQDIDSVMSDGLGMRYAFLGPLQTAHLNAEGFSSFCERYGKAIYDVSVLVFSQKFINLHKSMFCTQLSISILAGE